MKSPKIHLVRSIGAALATAVLLQLYLPTLEKLTDYWGANDMYSYGFLVPLVSAVSALVATR